MQLDPRQYGNRLDNVLNVKFDDASSNMETSVSLLELKLRIAAGSRLKRWMSGVDLPALQRTYSNVQLDSPSR